MRPQITTTVATYCLLALAGGVSFVLPENIVTTVHASPAAADIVRLGGVVRDFRASHPDFDAGYNEAPGQVAGLVGYTLDSGGNPTFDGAGNRVLAPAQDASGNNIAPVLANGGAAKGVNFSISNGKVIPSETFVARLTVLGSAMENAMAQMRVTVRLKVGATSVDAFGSFTNSAAGNVHDNNNPRDYIMSTPMLAGTAMSVTGRSWGLYQGNWTQFYNVDSAVGATGPGPTGPNCGTGMVKVLRNGDSVPNIPPFGSQSTIESYLQAYINPATKKVTIADNQAIFLFELATTDPNSAYYDYQDLVTLITMAAGVQAFSGPPVPTCGPTNDSAATMDPLPTTAGITTADTFQQWFSDTMGSNLSGPSSIDLVRQNDGTYVFDDTTDPRYSQLGGFYPADGRLYGDKDAGAHNRYFTYQFEAKFTYNSAVPQFFSTTSDMEVWVFIDGKLVIDLAGFHATTTQRIDLSRLCLQNNQEYTLSYFLASRYAPQAKLRIHTNLEFAGETPDYSVNAGFD